MVTIAQNAFILWRFVGIGLFTALCQITLLGFVVLSAKFALQYAVAEPESVSVCLTNGTLRRSTLCVCFPSRMRSELEFSNTTAVVMLEVGVLRSDGLVFCKFFVIKFSKESSGNDVGRESGFCV